MTANIMLSLIIVAFFIFVAIYKRQAVAKIFSLDSSHAMTEFRQQLESTADDLIERLEGRIQRLEYVVAEADVRIEQLERLLGEEKSSIAIADHQPSGEADFVSWQPSNGELPSAFPRAPSIEVLPETGGAGAGNMQTMPIDKGIRHERRNTILAMAQQGHTIADIAKTTGAGRGEIMLLLQLNRQ